MVHQRKKVLRADRPLIEPAARAAVQSEVRIATRMKIDLAGLIKNSPSKDRMIVRGPRGVCETSTQH